MDDFSIRDFHDPLKMTRQEYVASLHEVFLNGIVNGGLFWRSECKKLSVRRNPETHGYHDGFWHLIGGAENFDYESIEADRCQRLHWLPQIIRKFNQVHPIEGPVKWWKSSRPQDPRDRYLIARPDYSYVVVVDERPTYALLVTAYYVSRERRRNKLRREHDAFWEI